MGEDRLTSCLEPSGLSPAQSREIARSIQALITGNLVVYSSSDYPIPLSKLKSIVVKTCIDWIDAAKE
jgi:hypothetical protein